MGGPILQNLKVVLGPPTTVSLPSGGTAPGREVTWTWDPAPFVLYWTDITTAGVSPFTVRDVLFAATDPLLAGTTTPLRLRVPPAAATAQLSGTAPPIAKGIPGGSIVRLCASAVQPASIPPLPSGSSSTGGTTAAQGPYASCIQTLVP